jgi:hypothetical protein
MILSLSEEEIYPYAYALRRILPNVLSNGKSVDFNVLKEAFENEYTSLSSFGEQVYAAALQLLFEKDVFMGISYSYGKEIIIFRETQLSKLDNNWQIITNFQQIITATDRNSAEEWFSDVISEINDIVDANLTDYASIKNNDVVDQDTWLPLPIDRELPEYMDALKATEKAIQDIESNNGYASSEPEERNTVVETTKGTLAALKNGALSKGSVIESLLKPLKYISKKFGDSLMGVSAKEAVTALLKWLSAGY